MSDNERTRVEIPDGWYDMHLVRSEDDDGNSVNFVWDRNANGKTFLKGRMQLETEEFRGTVRTIELYLTDAAWPGTQKALRTMGWSGNDIYEIDREDLSKPVRGKVEARFFSGENGQEVRWEEVKAIGAGGGKIKVRNAMSHQDRRAFAARLMAQAHADPPAASDRTPWSRPNPDDDLPF